METSLAVLSGILFAAAVYLMVSRHTIRMLLGVVLLGNAVNLMLFAAGRVTRDVPPVIPSGQTVLPAAAANPLPQALILTAIVISFSIFCVLLVLVWRAYRDLGTDDTHAMRASEPADLPPPPGGY